MKTAFSFLLLVSLTLSVFGQTNGLKFKRALITEEIKSADEFVVELTISNTDAQVSGFVRLLEIIPEGYTAEKIASHGATFSFDGQKIRFLWIGFPNQDEVKVAYRLKKNNPKNTDLEITGTFAYVEANQKVSVSIPSTKF